MWMLAVYGGLGPIIIVRRSRIDDHERTFLSFDDRLVHHRGNLGRATVQLWSPWKSSHTETTAGGLHQNDLSNDLSLRARHRHLLFNYGSRQTYASFQLRRQVLFFLIARHHRTLTSVLHQHLQPDLDEYSMYKNRSDGQWKRDHSAVIFLDRTKGEIRFSLRSV